MLQSRSPSLILEGVVGRQMCWPVPSTQFIHPRPLSSSADWGVYNGRIPAILNAAMRGPGTPVRSFSPGPSASSRSWVIPQQYLVSLLGSRDSAKSATADAALLSLPPKRPTIAGPILARSFVAAGTRDSGISIVPLRPCHAFTAAVKLPWIWSLTGSAMPRRLGSRILMSCPS